ncbi:MAG TPA: aldehyde dehydrogenase [Candidatus Limnocylindria bacterium]|nr:aldehyde dehydrogenase [Candidatus Limnocylindria bacterium]
MQVHERLFIGGDWVAPATGATIDVVSPATEEVIARVPEAREADVDRAVAAARRAFDAGPWPRTPAAERADVMAALNAKLKERSDELATTITNEMGSPLLFSQLGQVMAATLVLDYYTNLARTYAFEEVRPGMLGPALVRREPVGVVAAIVPWNVPLFVTMLKLAPAMAAGATVVLKPAPETPLDAFILAEAAVAAGVPAGVLNVVPTGREVGEHLVRHPGVDKVAFTGSTAAGRRIAAICGEQLKRLTLELGGKSAAIILDDADLATTIPGLLPGCIMNNGQACVAQTRILVSRRRYDEVTAALVDAVRALPVGDPLDMNTMVGPLVAARQRDRVEGYIKIGREEGARIACGGGRPKSQRRGWYVEPTVFVDVDNRMRIAQEEIFGPVLSVIPYDDERDAVRIANDSEYGLCGSVWTTDVAHGVDVARQVRTGTYNVNGFTMEFSAPFGGFKASGIGRELGPEGLAAYLEPKTINLPMGFEPTLR